MTYHIYVNCVSLERFDVEADSPSEAIQKYERGECSQEADEVEHREISHVQLDGETVWNAGVDAQ